MFEIGQWIENQYLVLDRRRGRRWTIYSALDRMSESVFIIKRPSTASSRFSPDIFVQKSKLWINLGQCDELVTAFMLKEFQGAPHLFMEYIDGPSLADVICSLGGRPLPVRQIVPLAKQIIKGLKSLHGASLLTGGNMAHGNLNPRNILISRETPKISDPGLAAAFRVPGGIENADLLMKDMPCMAPEQIQDPSRSSSGADIYSLGFILYELITGTPPAVIKPTEDALAAGHVALEPVSPIKRNPACPKWLEGAIMKCLAREPENRFQKVQQIETLIGEIQGLVVDDEVSAADNAPPERASRVARARGVAKKESSRLNHYYLGVEHMMLGILAEESNIVLNALGDAIAAEEIMSRILASLPKGEGPWHWDGIIKTPRYRQTMKLARKIKHEYADERMLPQHILLAILLEGQNAAVRALKKLEVDVDAAIKKIRRELARRRPSILVTNTDAASTPFVHKVSCVTDGPYFTPFIGREKELKMARDFLSSDKHGIIVVGESGVGKTAFVQQLSCLITEAPSRSEPGLGSIYKLRTPSLLAGDYDADRVIDNLIDTLEELGKSESIAFIEDLPVLLGIDVKIPPMTAVEAIEEAISSYNLSIVATATPASYASCLEGNESLLRHFEIINLDVPPQAEIEKILISSKGTFEDEHSVMIAEDAIAAAIRLSAESGSNRALPGAALELLDRACAAARLAITASQDHPLPAEVAAKHVEHALSETFSNEEFHDKSSSEAHS